MCESNLIDLLDLLLQSNVNHNHLHLGRAAASPPRPPGKSSVTPLPLPGGLTFILTILQTFFLQSAPSSFTSYSPQFCCSALSYTTLPRRPAAPCWSPREGGQCSGARNPREGIPYDGVGPRTSALGELPPPPHRGEVGHPAQSHSSPPASLGSETLSSYCEPWGQVVTLSIFFPTQCLLAGGQFEYHANTLKIYLLSVV